MEAAFPRWSNSAFWIALAGLALMASSVVCGPMVYVRTAYSTGQFAPITQPVEFDHRHHVLDDVIECLYCHRSAEVSSSAGIPSTDVCMGCHAQIWVNGPQLDPVRRSYFGKQPIPWRRVHNLPDFVYFNHSVHVQRGIDCALCHGDVAQMARVYQVAPLTMGWCLDCHRNPEAYLGPNARELFPDSIAEISTQGIDGKGTGEGANGSGRMLTRLTTCTACHR